MDVGDIDTNLVVLFRLHTFRERHGLGLNLTEGVEGGDGLHALVGRHDGRERAVGIILKLLDSDATAKATALRQFSRMIEEVAMSVEVGNTTVVGKRLGFAQRHNLTGILPRTSRMGSRAIGYVLRHTAGSIEQLISL